MKKFNNKLKLKEIDKEMNNQINIITNSKSNNIVTF